MITPLTVATIYWEVPFYATLRCEVWQSGLLTCPITPYPHLCEGATVLGWEGPTANSQSTSLSGGSVIELWQAMELLVSFKEVGFFVATVPSNWTEVSSPRPMEPILQDPHHSDSCSQSCQALPRGSLLAAHGKDWPITTEKLDAPATPPWEMMLLQSNH